MSGVVKSDLHFRIGHVLFVDIVGYSNLLIAEQHDQVEQLNRLVRASHCFRTAEATGQLLCLPTGDGMALAYRAGAPLSRSGALAVPLLAPAGCAGVLAIEIDNGREQDAGIRALTTFFAVVLAQLVGGAASDAAVPDVVPAGKPAAAASAG